MIILDATTKKLQALLAGAVTTGQLKVVASYVDITTTTFVPGSQDASTNDTTAVDVVAAPASSTQRQVKYLSVYNADTASATVTVRYNDNGTAYPLVVVALASGSTLEYIDAQGWAVLTSSGASPAAGTLPDPVTVPHGGTGETTLAAHGLLVGAGTSGVNVVTAMTDGQLPVGQTGGDPLGKTVSGDATLAASGALTLATVATAGTYGQVTVNVKGLTTAGATCDVAHGGTGLTTLTAHAVYVGNGTSAPTALAVGATNTVLHGNTGADPSYSAVVEADITLANNTTNNASTSKHGFVPILPNDATKYYDGTGAYSVPAGGGGGGDLLATAVNADVAATINSAVTLVYAKRTVVKATTYSSGTTAWAATLPVPALSGGKAQYLEIAVDPASTKPYTLTANAGENVGPGTATTRRLFAGESAVLRTDGTNWFKVAGLTLPCLGVIRLGTSTTLGTATNNAQTKVPTDTSEVDSTGLMADTTNKRLNVQRAGKYAFFGNVIWANPSAGGEILTVLYVNGASAVGSGGQITSGHFPGIPSVHPAYAFAAGDYAEIYGGNFTGANQDFYGAAVGSDDASYVGLTEIPQW